MGYRERQGQLTGRHAVKKEKRGWTEKTILNRLTAAGELGREVNS